MEEVRNFLGPWYAGGTAKGRRYNISRVVLEVLGKKYGARTRDENGVANYECPYQLKRITSGLEYRKLAHTFVDVINDDVEDHILIEVVRNAGVVKHFAYTALTGPYEHAIREYFPKFVIKLPDDFYLFLKNPFHAFGIAARISEGCSFRDAEKSLLLHCPSKTVRAKPDAQYNKIIGVQNKTFEVLPEEIPIFRYKPEEIDEAIYHRFKEICNESCMDRSGKDHGKKMSKNPAATEFIHSSGSMQFLHATKCRDVFTPEQIIGLSNGIISNFVVPVYKPDNVTSDGKLRSVFSMPPTLEAWLRIKFRFMRYDTLPGYVKNPFTDIDEELKYSYDVIKCDERVAQYWYKYCSETHGKELDLLYPFVKNGDEYFRPAKLPSGVLHTSLVVNAFVCAYLEVYCSGLRYQFQGDGIITSEKIVQKREWFRRVRDCALNGFNKGAYMRPWKLGSHAWLRNGGYPTGKVRYWVRYFMYLKMNANLQGFPVPKDLNGLNVFEATPKQVSKMFEDRNWKVPKKLSYILEEEPRPTGFSELVCRDVSDYRLDYVGDNFEFAVHGQTMVRPLGYQ